MATAIAEENLILDAETFNPALHDGMVTVFNPATGQHRTFKIRTQAADATFAPGKRVVSLLRGADRDDSGDWTAFAFADERGIWACRKFADTEYVTFARILADPRRWAGRGLEYRVEVKCRRCGRPLTHPESLAEGLGPTCASKV